MNSQQAFFIEQWAWDIDKSVEYLDSGAIIIGTSDEIEEARLEIAGEK